MRVAALFSLTLVSMIQSKPTSQCIKVYGNTYVCSEITVKYSEIDKQADIHCHGNILDCSKLQQFNAGHNMSLSYLRVESCSLNSSLQCLLSALNATDTETLRFEDIKTPITKETVKGLNITESLYVYDSVNQTIPVEAMKTLPNLKMLRVNNIGLRDLPLNSYSDVKDLRYLQIVVNNISSLPGNAFLGLNKVENLNLNANHIQVIDVNSFKGLDSLKNLFLKENEISSLPPGVFQHTPNLRIIRLDKQLRLKLEEGVLTRLSRLEELVIKDCEEVVLGSKALSRLPTLKDLNLQNSSITNLPADLFEDSTGIINLTLGDNKISYIPETIFKGLKALKDLILSNNKIKTITGEHFLSLTNLREIYLNGNIIENLPNNLFSTLPNLKNVSLANNLIRHIDEYAFLEAKMKSLNLSNNQLDWTCSNGIIPYISPLSQLTEIMDLDLSNNSIKAVCSDWTQDLITLQHLNLAHNDLTELWSEDIVFLSNNVEVNLRNNSITIIHVNSSYIEEQPTLLLGGNPFNCDCNLYNFLHHLDKLPYQVEDATCDSPLSLKHISLSSIATGKQGSSVSLEKLICPSPESTEDCTCILRPEKNRMECDCKGNLNNLPNPALSGLSETQLKLASAINLKDLPSFVTVLNMSHLELKTIPNIPETVKHIDLSYNRLSRVPLDILNRANFTLELRNNSFNCDCEGAEDIANIQRVHRENEGKIRDFMSLFCTDGFSVDRIDPPRLCYLRDATVISASLVGVSVFLLVVGILYYKYSLDIKIYLYNHGWSWLNKEESLDADKKYDIFISFAHEDEQFVNDKLLPNLDNDYKVCVHTRDWNVGEVIVEQIYRSVADSRRTLIVFSKAFLESMWALEEFRAAYNQTVKDRRPRIVVILLDDVKYDTAPELIKNYLNLTTYIEWKDSIFWEKLRYALPRKITAEDVRKKRTTELAVKNLSKGGINMVLNEEGKIVNAGDVNMKLGVITPKYIKEGYKVNAGEVNKQLGINKPKDIDLGSVIH